MRSKRGLAGKNVVVTGGAGFIGSHLCDRIIREDPGRLVIIDDFSLGKTRNVKSIRHNKCVKVYRQDATDYKGLRTIVEREGINVVFNLAVIPLPMSLVMPRETVLVNVEITANVCELLRKGKFESLVHCSSSEAYGTALYVPMDEGHPEKPLTPYAASKIASDQTAISYYKTFGLDISIARPFNCYGPRQNERSYAGVIPLTIHRILSGEAPVVFGDGKQTRDYTYVADTVEGIIGVFACDDVARGRIVNIASGREVTIMSLIKKIVKLMDYKGEIVHGPDRPGDVRRHRGDISFARRLFGFSAKVDLERGLSMTIDWYRRNYRG